MKKYNQKFDRDFRWYLTVRHYFNFDGTNIYYNKKGNTIINISKSGIDGIESFYQFDTYGKISETKHPNILHTLLKVKGSVNLHIKMYAEDRAKGVLPKMLFNEICADIKAPDWFVDAVETQKYKYY